MNNQWLDHGHGADPSNLPPVFSQAPAHRQGDHGGGRGSTTSGRNSWISGPWSVAIVAAVAVVGCVGATYGIRASLFPNIGGPGTQSVWENPAPLDEPLPASTEPASTEPTSTEPTSTEPATTSTTAPSADVAVGVNGAPAPSGTGSSATTNTGTSTSAGGGSGSGSGDDHDDERRPADPSLTAPAVTLDDHGGDADDHDDPASDDDHDDSSGSGSGPDDSDDTQPDD